MVLGISCMPGIFWMNCCKDLAEVMRWINSVCEMIWYDFKNLPNDLLESLDQKMWQGIVGDIDMDQKNLFGRRFLIFLQFSTCDVKFIMLIRNVNNRFSRNFHVHCPKSLGMDGTPQGQQRVNE